MRKLIFFAKARKVPFEIMLHFSVSTGQAAVESTAKNRDPVKNTVPETNIANENLIFPGKYHQNEWIFHGYTGLQECGFSQHLLWQPYGHSIFRKTSHKFTLARIKTDGFQ